MTRMLLMILLPLASSAQERAPSKGLPREAALERSARVSRVRYELRFAIDGAKDDFTGSARILFRLKDPSRPLTVDFAGGKVLRLAANGRDVAQPAYNGHFITIPGGDLAEGDNELRVEFSHPYSKSGAGFHRFRDPADGSVYVYTDFEPYDANQLFPCFDQPDLKAVFSLDVEAPQDWLVVSATAESEVGRLPGGRRLWSFPDTKPISTYIFPLHAGPWVEWKSSFGDVPLRLLARRSAAEHVPVEEWFRVTRQGLAFFNEYFGFPYPFGKYDQVLAPDFNSGAMENLAAVTFNERYVQRGKSTRHERYRRASVILHEMAHMWFGNLVTMQWWDDLWLNESFATYMATLALQEATEFKEAPSLFHLLNKQWAYWEDQLVTTHPIEADVPDTEQAFANFDGITYGKGASVMKQVAYLVGERAFRDGTRLYFRRHAFGNARRADFIAALEKASGRRLQAWTEEWLRTAGVNGLQAEWECREGRISSFRLLQSAPPEHPTLRSHRTAVGLYADAGGVLLPARVVPGVEYSTPSTELPSLLGTSCPLLAHPNEGDHDYAKVRLDEASLAAAVESLPRVGDPLTRAMLWLTLWDMVQDAELPVLDYAELVRRHLPAEKDAQIALKVVETLHGRRPASHSVMTYLSGQGRAWRRLRLAEAAKFEDMFWGLFRAAEPGSDFQKLWFDAYSRLAATDDGLERLARALEGKEDLKGLELDQDRRWTLVAQLSRFGASGSAKLLEREKERDPSRRGQTLAIAAEASRPGWKVKRRWLERMLEPEGGLALADARAAMESLFPAEQEELRGRFGSEFYRSLPKLAASRPSEFVEPFATHLAPAACGEEEARELAAFLESQKDLTPVALKPLRVARQEAARCAKARALASPRDG